MTGKNISTEAFVGLVACVNLGMAFEIVTTDKALAAVVTLVLAVTQVGLDVGLDVLLPAKPSLAARVETDPFAILGVRTRDV